MSVSKIREASKKAHVLFEKYGWEWYDGKPTVKMIEDCFLRLQQDIIERDSTRVFTGRLCVERVEDLYFEYLVSVGSTLGEEDDNGIDEALNELVEEGKIEMYEEDNGS